MSLFTKFITLADELVAFNANFDETPIVEKTLSSLRENKGQVQDLWDRIKLSYCNCLKEEDSLLKEDIEACKAKYRSSADTYINCLTKIINSSRKLNLIESDKYPYDLVESPLESTPNIQASKVSPSIKVPPCDTEIFYGDYLTWPSFRDMFSAVYVNHPKLCSVQKLFHLRAKTKGDANKIVAKFPLTENNFELAWKALTDEYENKRILVNNQLKKLFNLSAVSYESGKEIKELQRNINDCLSILKTHDISISSWDPILIYLCSTRLPETTLSLWEQSINNPRDLPLWVEMDEFLTNRYRILETVSDIKLTSKPRIQSFKQQQPQSTFKKQLSETKHHNHKFFHSKPNSICCKLCNNSHPLRLCAKFLQLSIQDRIAKVELLNYCTNCLSHTHLLRDCKSIYTCSICKQRHHSLLHLFSTKHNPTPLLSNEQTDQHNLASTSQTHAIQSTNDSKHINIQSYFSRNNKRVLLATALVDIHHSGNVFTLRAFLDTGSEVTFISERAQRRLSLPVKPIYAQISGMNSVVTGTASKLCALCIGSKHVPSFTLTANAIVLKNLTGDLPSCSIRQDEVSDPIGLTLADPYFFESSQIDLVIGMDIYPAIIKEGTRYEVFGSLLAQNTIFGWVLSGPLPHQSIKSFSTSLSSFSDTSLEQQIAKFWEVENLPLATRFSADDQYCEQLFDSTTSRDENGRYMVRLPFKSFPPLIGHSRDIALTQYNRLKKTLEKKPDLHEAYYQILNEYLTLGHMKLASQIKIDSAGLIMSYYLPHHAVVKPTSTTTKVRVVFNASKATTNGISLNDVLYTGPALQADLTILILRWRFYKFVFNADIEKMYRQVLVHPEDSSYQRIVFQNQDFELLTVTFGVNCAPYLANRTLLELAKSVKSSSILAYECLMDERYVDDFFCGAHDLKTALQKQSDLITVLDSAKFPLRKWTSNCLNLLKNIPTQHLYKEDFLKFEDESISKTLGILWNAKLDAFQFRFETLEENHNQSKRTVLSIIAKLFDPAGWLAPIIITAKLIMQQIWRDGTSWDCPLEPLTCQRWKSFVSTLPDVREIKIPRWIQFSPKSSFQIHGFCDASEHAYAAAFYLRVQVDDNNWISNLLCAKSKVAPVNQISLPRLELNGALLLAKMFQQIISNMKCSSKDTYLWTDSSIVLAWLSKPCYTWKTFVGNRVSEIQSCVANISWNHVRSAENPADLATRGLTPRDLKDNSLWWHGPKWLQNSEHSWLKTSPQIYDETKLETRVLRTYHTFISCNIETLINKYSSLTKMLNVLSYLLRFLHRLKREHNAKFSYQSKVLTHAEVSNTKKIVIKMTQILYYPREHFDLLNNKPISKKSPLLCLNPILDCDGIIRSNGRLSLSSMPYSERYPIILPYGSHLSLLLVKFAHELTMHGGNRLVIRVLRCEFWIPKIKTLVKKHIGSCKQCIINKRKTREQIMAALPIERTTISLPFTNTGVDFAGPFDIKSFLGRNCRLSKGYVCLFICFATRAIHLEATSDLSSQLFLAALSRFIARRGMPKTLFSDNGTNFIGAEKILNKNFKEVINEFSTKASERYKVQNLEWKFIPPGAPHMGGLWEAGVKSFKMHLRRVAGSTKFTFEEFSTLLAKIEACLNSRPISPMSENSDESPPLTPGHFLRGGASISAS